MPPKAAGAAAKTNGKAPNGKSEPKSDAPTAKNKPAAPAGTSTPSEDTLSEAAVAHTGFSKPDKASYDKEQETLKNEIESLNKKLAAVRIKMDAGKGSGPGADRRKELLAELDSIRSAQGNVKSNRQKIQDQIKTLQDNAASRAKTLQASKSKSQYKSTEEVDKHIKDLEKQVEGGKLTLAGEKRALNDISSAKRLRKTVEGYQAEQDLIDGDRAKADELRKELNDPESVAMSERYDKIKTELDSLKAADDEARAGRDKVYDEFRTLKTQLDESWNKKKESAKNYREAGDRYYKKAQEERARRQERFVAERKAAENEKKKEIALRLREEASVPAFQADIEDCQTLIDTLTAKLSGGSGAISPSPNSATGLAPRSEIVGVPKLETRTVDAPAEGLVARKKKGEEETNYFVAKKRVPPPSKSNGKAPTPIKTDSLEPPSSPATPSDAKLNLPYSTLSALLQLSIPPPTSVSDVPRAVEDLKTKKAWFEANQARVTKENITKADAEIKRLEAADANGEYPIEPAPTPAASSKVSDPVPSEAVVDELETVKETEVEA